MQRRIVRVLLDKWGYNVLEAASGPEALDICCVSHVDIIISDWVMPEMTGVEFCRRFRALDRDSYGYFMLLTSKSETDEIVNGLELGADDFLTKPVNSSELRARLMAGERVLKMEQELQAKNALVESTLSELQVLYDTIDRDLAQARKIQDSLVTERQVRFGPNLVSMLLKPCGHVGGDLVGAFSPGTNRLGFYGIDVSGHGVTSAMMTARLAGYLSTTFPEHNVALERRFEKFFALLPPEVVAQGLNERLIADTGVEEYFTMVYCTMDMLRGEVCLVQAGHPHPAIIHRDGSVDFVGAGGPPIGLLPDVGFDAFKITLQPGERLMIYSDGFTESEDADGRMLEEDGLTAMIRSNAHLTGPEFLEAMSQDLTARLPDGKLLDDVSALVLDYNGPQ